MTTIRHLAVLGAGLMLACGLAGAQPGPAASAPGPGCGPMGGASAAAADCPRGTAGPRRHMVAHWGPGYTSGWPMMTPAERQEHQAKLAGLKTYEECRAYMDQHHEQRVARAKDKGLAMPAKPRRDGCAGLPKAN